MIEFKFCFMYCHHDLINLVHSSIYFLQVIYGAILCEQVIALNGSLAAEGELYIDDGKSYDFEQGAYIHRRFIFTDRKLTSIDIRPSNVGDKKFSADCTVERIILLGLPSGAKKAVVEPGNHETNIELGPLTLRRASPPVALTIRKPNVRVTDDWSLRIL